MAEKIQTSFAAGELSPTLYARVDFAKYHIGAARMHNFFVDYRGGASNRTGFELVARALISTAPVRLIRFQFSTIQNYELEFGDHYIRVIKDGGLVLESPITIISISTTNPGVVSTGVPHGYATGDQLYFIITSGMPQINEREYFAVVTGAQTLTLTDWQGNPVNTAGYTPFVAGYMARIYKQISPYAAADLALLKFVQSADVMTLTHPDYPAYDLSRTSDTSWTFTPVTLGSAIVAPAAPTVSITGGAANGFYAYKITAVDVNGQESVASPAGTAGSKVNITTTAGSANINWAAVPGAVQYNVYKALVAEGSPIPNGALFGYMTTVTGTNAVDTNIVPDFTVGPPTNQDPLVGNNPGAVTYHQQRKVYAGSDASPETFWMSRPGQFDNFDVSFPVQPSDAITGTLVSRQVNRIKHMISMPNGLIMLTSGGAWQVSGVGEVLSPSTIQATPQAYNGCNDMEPLTINYQIIYVQQKGTVVRDLNYSFNANIYTGTDISLLSNHLFAGLSLLEWTFAEEPFKIIWAVRDDGALLSLTYLKEQEIYGWAKHTTNGLFKSISSIQEGLEDAVYAVVERTLNGVTAQYIERMHSRLMAGPADAFFVDCGVTYSGVPEDTFGGLEHLEGEIVTILGDGNVFPPQTVINGRVMLSQEVSKAAIGLAIPNPQLQTLYLDLGNEGSTVQGKRKTITALTARVTETRGLWMGQDFTNMDEFKDRDLNTIGQPIPLFTGDQRMILPGGWNTEGQMCLEQRSPLPCTVLGVIPEFTIGDDAK